MKKGPVFLTHSGHIIRMDDNADAKRILLASPLADSRSSPHHVAQHRPTGSETTPPYAPWSSRFGSAEDDVDVWRYAILELHARNDDNDDDDSVLREYTGSDSVELSYVMC